ncbi:hypothetical protein, partial [Thiolapillus sp.]|uniref:hypothetical protein n=1 Tax=Thiolapillus sp. TaxID=2017437 RepID=UPI003AF50081
RLADDIDGLAGEEEELANLVERLDKASTAYGMEISAEKTRLMTNNTSGINTEIKVNGQKLETVTTQPTLYIGPTRAPCGFVGFCVGPCMRAWYLTGTFRASPVRCGWRDNTSKPAFRPPSADRSPSACGYLSREAEYRMVLK